MRGRAGRKGVFPLDTCLLHYVSIMLAELMGFIFTLVYVLTTTRSAALRVCSVQLRQSGALRNRYAGFLYIWRRPEHEAAIQLNFAPSRQEVKRQKKQYNIRLLFQNKTPSVDTRTQISKKRQTQVLLLIPLSGNMEQKI